MVLTNKQKAVIENDFNEKGWNAYKICKEHPSFECSRMVVHNLIKKIKETRSTERKGSGRPVTATTEESHLGYRSANHQFIAWSRKRIFIATNV